MPPDPFDLSSLGFSGLAKRFMEESRWIDRIVQPSAFERLAELSSGFDAIADDSVARLTEFQTALDTVTLRLPLAELASSFSQQTTEPVNQLAEAHAAATDAARHLTTSWADELRPTLEAFRSVEQSIAGALSMTQASLAKSGIFDEARRLQEQGRAIGSIVEAVAPKIPADTLEGLKLELSGLAGAVSLSNFPVLNLGSLAGFGNDRWVDVASHLRTRASDLINNPDIGLADIEDFANETASVTASAPLSTRPGVSNFCQTLLINVLVAVLLQPLNLALQQQVAERLVVIYVLVHPSQSYPNAASRPSTITLEALPDVILRAGPSVANPTLEFFNSQVRSPSTRRAYFLAATRFFIWCEDKGVDFDGVTADVVSDYVAELERKQAPATVKQHVSAIRRLFANLVAEGVLTSNPVDSVRAPRIAKGTHQSRPLSGFQIHQLLESIDPSTIAGLRDRALIALMLSSDAPLSKLLDARSCDYRDDALYLQGSGRGSGKLPLEGRTRTHLAAYLEAAVSSQDDRRPLFRTIDKRRKLTSRHLDRNAVWYMVKRRSRAAGLEEVATYDSLRATRIGV